MNAILKSIFIALFPVIALYFSIASIVSLISNGVSYPQIGLLVSSFTIVLFFILLFLKPVARTSSNLKSYTLFISIGFLGSVLSNSLNNSIYLAIPAIGLFLGWVLYLKWYSVFTQRKENMIIRVGEKLPRLELEDADKNKVNTSKFTGNPSIYLFYRGNWCPLCMAQIQEIATQYKELQKRNINMVFISPQPHGYTKSLAKKFEIHFNYLVDKNNKVAKQLQIFSKNGIPMGFQVLGYDSNTVMPTVIITDSNEKIIFADLTDNYRVRPEPETFLKIIDQQNTL